MKCIEKTAMIKCLIFLYLSHELRMVERALAGPDKAVRRAGQKLGPAQYTSRHEGLGFEPK